MSHRRALTGAGVSDAHVPLHRHPQARPDGTRAHRSETLPLRRSLRRAPTVAGASRGRAPNLY